MEQLLRLLTLQDANTRTVLIGASLLGIASAVIGAFAVLRRRALVGDAVAHAALPGICLAYFVVGDRNFAAFMLGALIMGMVAAAFIALVKSVTRIKEDAAIGMAIGGFFGLGIVLSRIIQNQPAGNRAGLDSFIFGKAASMVGDDAILIAIISTIVVCTVAVLYKEFKILCFDRDFSASQGWPTLLLDLALMALVCLCTVAGLPAVGVVLMVSLLVIPPVAARFWTNRLGPMVLLSAAFGGAAGLLGTALSATVPAPVSGLTRGWPTGPLITLVAAAIFVVSLLVAPRRGLIADLVRRVRLRKRIAGQNFLRSVYELLEAKGDLAATWSIDDLDRFRSGRKAGTPEQVRLAIRSGTVRRAGERYTMTSSGWAQAAEIVRTHRLWEMFLISRADVAADQVDRDADRIEHVLAPETVAMLELELIASGRAPKGVPASPHPEPNGNPARKAGS